MTAATVSPSTMITEATAPHLTDTELIELIKFDGWMAGIEISDRQAGYIIEMFQRAVEEIRTSPDQIYILSKKDMEMVHGILEKIVEDDVREARDGSAHEALNLRFLRGNEACFVHTFAEFRGVKARHCAFAIALNTTPAA